MLSGTMCVLSLRRLLTLSFDEIQQIAGIPIDHSFLQYKKELASYGWQVQKISMKGQTVCFARTDS